MLLVPRLIIDGPRLQEILLHRQCKHRDRIFGAILQVWDVPEHAIEEHLCIVVIQLYGIDEGLAEERVGRADLVEGLDADLPERAVIGASHGCSAH